MNAMSCSAGLAAERVADALGIRENAAADPLDAIARLFQVHPAFQPRAYIDLRIERTRDAVLCTIGDGPAFESDDSIFGMLCANFLGDAPGVESADCVYSTFLSKILGDGAGNEPDDSVYSMFCTHVLGDAPGNESSDCVFGTFC